jgi:hypothetical protein
MVGDSMEWIKYSFVCNGECDALLEFTFKDGFDWPSGVVEVTCPCGSNTTLLSVDNATINNNNEQKEDSPMNATTEYLESMVSSLQEQLKSHQNCDYWKRENGRIQSQIIDTLNDAIEDTYKSRNEIITEIAEIIDYALTKEIQFTATMRFVGTISVPALEAEDFDLSGVLDEAYVDINNGDVIIDSYELYDAEEC